MTKTNNIELTKLIKKYKVLKFLNICLFCYGILLFILIALENHNIIDIPFYEQRLPISHRVFLNTWVGIPIIFIQKKLKKIDERIEEIESMYRNKK